MPLNPAQIQKLNSIPNRVKIFGEFSQELKDKKYNYLPGNNAFAAGSGILFNRNHIYDFISDNIGDILKSPLSSIRNDLNEWVGYNDWNFPSSILTGRSTFTIGKGNLPENLLEINGKRVIAGYVTSGTGVLTDKYLNSLEICYIEDESGGIGLMFNHGISPYTIIPDSIQLDSQLRFPKFSYLNSKTTPLKYGGTTAGFNLLSDDYRHNLRIGDLVIVYSGEYLPGQGRTFNGDPTWLVDPNRVGDPSYGRYYSMQGPSFISNIKDFHVDTEFRGMSPLPLERRVFPTPSLQEFKKVGVGDNRLVKLRQVQFVKSDTTLEPFPATSNIVFEPSKSYWLTSAEILQTWGKPIEVCISPFTEIARNSVRIPDRPIDIVGILVQDSARDQRVLFPRFLRDIYGNIYRDL